MRPVYSAAACLSGLTTVLKHHLSGLQSGLPSTKVLCVQLAAMHALPQMLRDHPEVAPLLDPKQA